MKANKPRIVSSAATTHAQSTAGYRFGMTTDSQDEGAATSPEAASPKKRRRWPFIVAAIAVVAAFGALGYLVYDLNEQVDDLNGRISSVSGRTESDIRSLESAVSSLESDIIRLKRVRQSESARHQFQRTRD